MSERLEVLWAQRDRWDVRDDGRRGEFLGAAIEIWLWRELRGDAGTQYTLIGSASFTLCRFELAVLEAHEIEARVMSAAESIRAEKNVTETLPDFPGFVNV
jgi:hypothetical protein